MGVIQVHNIFFASWVCSSGNNTVSHFQSSSLHRQPNTRPHLIIIVIIIVVVEAHVLSSGGRRPRSVVSLRAACRLLLGGDEVYDGCDDGTVFGLAALPVDWSGVTDLFLQ